MYAKFCLHLYITVIKHIFQATNKDTEQRTPQLCLVRDLAEALKALLTEENLIDDKVSLLNSNWIAVTSRSEQWLHLLLVRKQNWTIFTYWTYCIRDKLYDHKHIERHLL